MARNIRRRSRPSKWSNRRRNFALVIEAAPEERPCPARIISGAGVPAAERNGEAAAGGQASRARFWSGTANRIEILRERIEARDGVIFFRRERPGSGGLQ